ncbi:actin-related protein 2/3 complex subunit 1A-like [Acanthaster planci]|uniref:Actin-related protein 2/3 complex subunit n=1 Tax=Acanthaster planci TaxID=133434 RepID=A0A8B7XI53_ACAPL|nr:actin-related protein 2/3 complex subunit 1A-like [Acanthaster planci]XP_022080475.1 actin-related protein 2/3 complex subunit 1A-like [Acanthaster planci]XP_022080476.1 actin-related protein 2/3 complex subunit 1A-like [Acanthaster planci]
MSNNEKFNFELGPITCHAWNKDRSQIAISPNSHEVHIYAKKGPSYEKLYTLSEHTQRVTSIDWAPNSNRLVTCGTDRNAYVWTLNGKDGWKPTLVILRINRAATCVKWSPLENKFAVGSGARLISVCYFEQENDWWVSKHIKKPIRSTVTSLDWHPNNYLLAAGSADFKARVFSAYIKEIEDKPEANSWGKKMPFGNCMQELSAGGSGGWVHSVAFDASGTRLAWVGHDSTVSVVNSVADFHVGVQRTGNLPFLTCEWAGPHSLVVAGHDCELILFNIDDSEKVTFVSKLGVEKKKESGNLSAMAKFRQLDKKATTEQDTARSSVHQNSITQISIHSGSKENITKLTSTSVDGQVVIWNYKSLESAVAGMRV